ncbi:ABC transporter permease [Clostridium sediminicola]|uniref:ABC transporter permease n=1 Tax=Clostridium sediminicola TaxID=3114879 RepID=UPI0031F21E3F
MEKLKNGIKSYDKSILTLFGIAVGIVVVMTFITPDFLQVSNVSSMAFQFPEFGILCFGMMICMISGGIDLSLVGTANLSGIVAALIIITMGSTQTSIIIGIIAAIVVGALCGLFNGYLIGQLQIPAMLVTLCGGQLFTGLGVVITKGPAITGLPESLQIIANGSILGFIPIAFVIFVLIAIGLNFILKYTVYGKQLSFMGTNESASRYAGINNLRVTLITYMLSGILAAIAGIIIISHYGSAKSDYGTSYILLTLLIVVLGGVAPSGGKGKVLGVSLAVIILQMISSAFNILRFNAFIKTLAWGLLLIVVMVVKAILQEHPIKFRTASSSQIKLKKNL